MMKDLQSARELLAQDLIDAFEAGEMGDVEFTERALDAGMSIYAIGEVLRRVRDDEEF